MSIHNQTAHILYYPIHMQMAREHWMVSREEIEMTKEELGRGGWGVVKVAKFRGLRDEWLQSVSIK